MKIIEKAKSILKQGLTPKELAKSTTAAVLIGVIPVFGISTALISVTALKFKLNLAWMMLVSYLIYPIQILLFIPYIKFGEWMFGIQNSGITIEAVKQAFSTNVLEGLRSIFVANLLGFIAWGASSILLSYALYKTLKLVFLIPVKVRKRLTMNKSQQLKSNS